jgi:hypothetical protein
MTNDVVTFEAEAKLKTHYVHNDAKKKVKNVKKFKLYKATARAPYLVAFDILGRTPEH